MTFTATQWLTKFTTISTATTAATIGGYIPAASTAAQVYAFSAANVATTNARAYVDIFYNDGNANVVNFVRGMPIDPGGAKPINTVNKHTIMATGFISAAIYATTGPVAFIMTVIEIT